MTLVEPVGPGDLLLVHAGVALCSLTAPPGPLAGPSDSFAREQAYGE